MSTVRVYKSTDPGAPAHPSSLRGSMAALLRACLVTGYGSGPDFKAPAGWEEPFPESGNNAVFRSLVPNSSFFRIDDNQADADIARIGGYTAMSDSTNGTAWVSTSTGMTCFGKRYTGTSIYSTEWWVIADEETCYVFLKSIGGLIPHGFGRYKCYLSEVYTAFIAGHGTESGLPSTSTTTSLFPGMASVWSLGGSATNPIMYAQQLAGTGATLIAAAPPLGLGANFPGNLTYADPAVLWPGGDYIVLPWILTGTTFVGAAPIGQFRGLFIPMAPEPRVHGEVFGLGGNDYLALTWGISTASANKAQMFIKLGTWD